MARQLIGRILFLGVTADRRTLGFVAPGDSQVAAEFNAHTFPQAFVVFREIPLPVAEESENSKKKLLAELRRIHLQGWIDSKQLDKEGKLKPCVAPQCGGFTLEAELGIPKNSDSEPDYLGWEVKQHSVDDFDKIESSKAITLLTPEPTGGFYKDYDVEAFVRKFGYKAKDGQHDRLNFSGRHFVGNKCSSTGLILQLVGYDAAAGKITDANGEFVLVSDSGEVAASWSFKKILEHWSRKHMKAVYVPSIRRTEPQWQYAYGHKVRLAQRTDSLRLLKAFATGEVYYDPGINLKNASSENPKSKKRSQFRVASKNIAALYETVELVEL